MSWRNWSGRVQAPSARLHHLKSEADAQALVKQSSGTIRATGAGHSHAPLVTNDDLVVNTDGLSGLVSTDPTAGRATFWAGTRIFAMGRPLHDIGLALTNQGDIDQQSISGATGTGTHGTGTTLKNFSSTVTAITLVTADGSLITANKEQHAELFEAARLHLGAFGLITRLELQCCAAYKLQQSGGEVTFEALQGDIDQLMNSHRHFEFFWYPQNDTAATKITNETSAPAQYPLAEEGARCAWSYEVLPNHRPHKHTEMEYSVPAEQGIACFAEIRRLLHTKFKDVRWPVEYRSLAADDVWLSTAYQRDTVTISVHQDVREDETAYYRACEEIFLHHSGRPHWGKVHYLNGDELAACHPRWQDWWRVRDAIDPLSRFVGPHLGGLRPK